MRLILVLPCIVIAISVVSNAFPTDDNTDDTLADDVGLRYGPQNGQRPFQQQPQRRPDATRAPALDPGCRIVYETKFEVEEVESVRQECRQWTENKCTTKTRPKCTPWTDNVCETKYRQKCRNWTDKECKDSWRNDCNERFKEECKEYNKDIQVPYEEDECNTRKERRCDKHWEEKAKGHKEWVDNPNSCKYYDVTDCNPVTKYRTESEKYTKCDDVPYQHCDRVKDTNCYDVPKQECNNEPWQDCHDVQRERCHQESWQDCQDYPREKCNDVHEKVPTQVAKQVPVRVCDGHGGGGLFDIREGLEEPEKDVEQFDQTREHVDSGLLQTKLPVGQKKAETDDKVSFTFADK